MIPALPAAIAGRRAEEDWAMMRFRQVAVAVSIIVVVGACGAAALAAEGAASDAASIHGINEAWEKAYNAGDADRVAALYADDAVLLPPGVPGARGHAALREALAKDIAGSAAAGVTLP